MATLREPKTETGDYLPARRDATIKVLVSISPPNPHVPRKYLRHTGIHLSCISENRMHRVVRTMEEERNRGLPHRIKEESGCFFPVTPNRLLHSTPRPRPRSRADPTRLDSTGLIFIGPSGVLVPEFGLNKKGGKRGKCGNNTWKTQTSRMGNQDAHPF
jgi:hypothetical protein